MGPFTHQWRIVRMDVETICSQYTEKPWPVSQCAMVFQKILQRKLTHQMPFLLLWLPILHV